MTSVRRTVLITLFIVCLVAAGIAIWLRQSATWYQVSYRPDPAPVSSSADSGIRWRHVREWTDAAGQKWRYQSHGSLSMADGMLEFSTDDGTTWKDGSDASWQGQGGIRYAYEPFVNKNGATEWHIRQSTDGGTTWSETPDGNWIGADGRRCSVLPLALGELAEDGVSSVDTPILCEKDA